MASLPPHRLFDIEYVNQPASKLAMHKCFWCFQLHRDDATWHAEATVEQVWMDGESLGATTDRKINHTDELKGTNGAMNQIIFAPQGQSWASWEQR
jgi:hypothetical protein